mmetsp:Transcript_16288/g.18445  ORF Transcript_16288/g.18445 Transcript_16288/m.18445 type:complete len:177 (-) Transcript_16288:439-969(-)
MVRGSKNLKSRRPKVRQNRKHPRRSAVRNAEVKRFGWTGKKTLLKNYEALGLAAVVNEPLVQRKSTIETLNVKKILKAAEEKKKGVQKGKEKHTLAKEWEDLDSERALTGYRLTADRRPDNIMSEEEMKYIKPLIQKYKDDYKKMFRDIRLNSLQKTETWISKKVQQYIKFTNAAS